MAMVRHKAFATFCSSLLLAFVSLLKCIHFTFCLIADLSPGLEEEVVLGQLQEPLEAFLRADRHPFVHLLR